MTSGDGNDSQPVAAVDLGSNSFHLIIGRELGGQLSVLDRLRTPVRLAAGLDEEGRLAEETVERALDSLRKFGQRLRDLPPARVRAIGTNTFRRAKAPRDFLARASDALGFPIEVLSGLEEARLIYLGVSHEQPRIEGRRLVVDIGGGSTECVIGLGLQPVHLDSLYMGCVSYSLRYFPDGRLTRKAFRRAEVAARLELETIQRRFLDSGWRACVGSSGTIKAIGEILRTNGWMEHDIQLAGIKRLRRVLIENERLDRLDLPGLTTDRAPVLAGGLAILKAVFESLEIDGMRASKAALREGLLYDLLGRIRSEDVRDRTIATLVERYAIDQEQSRRVEQTALRLFVDVAEPWELEPLESQRLLGWAARLHEIGLALSYANHHKHGAYILANSHMPGFSRDEQARLAALVGGHRRKFSRDRFDVLLASWRERIFRLSTLLRLAVRLNRTRSKIPLPELELHVKERGLELVFPEGWLDDHPLTRADIEREGEDLKAGGVELDIR